LGMSWDVKPIITALMNNPLPLVIPCHRIVENDREIGDYIWGIKIKERLLRLEAINKNKKRNRIKQKEKRCCKAIHIQN